MLHSETADGLKVLREVGIVKTERLDGICDRGVDRQTASRRLPPSSSMRLAGEFGLSH